MVAAICLSAATATAQTYEVLKAFSSGGFYPSAGVIQGTDGNLYGTTYSGGASGYGTIFKIDTSSSTLTTLHSFTFFDGGNPTAVLIQGTDGNLYGTTYAGGTSGYGTAFKIDTNGTTLTTLHSFSNGDGASPAAGLIQAMDGNLYGTTYYGGANNDGTIFKIDTNGTTFISLHSFSGSDGAYPYAGLIQGTDGNLYGTTTYEGPSNYGTIFKIDTTGSTFSTLHSFAGGDGANPYAGLIQGSDGSLYGTSSNGGSGYGTIFKIDTNGSTFSTLHNFVNSDGADATAGLIQGSDGSLYGTAARGGASDNGTIFKTDASGTAFTTLHSFAGSDGAYAGAGVIQGTDGNLYGTTYAGGASGFGTIFKTDTNGTAFTTLHSFAPPYSDGAGPRDGLIQGTDGNLYGTTLWDGPGGYGTIFKTDTNGTTFTTLHSFATPYYSGLLPWAGLIQGTDGNLYGTTTYGGANNLGTIFKIDTNGSTFTTLHSFAYTDGAGPYAALVQGTDGNLYGTTPSGGASGLGTIFKIDTNGTTFITLHSFAGSDGSYTQAGLIQGTDGNLYGTTPLGGGGGCYLGCGTIFKIDTSGATFITLHTFVNGDGASPLGGLIQGTDGNLYGTTAGGGASGNGTVFKTDTNGTTLTILYSFSWSDGAGPEASLIQATDGNLYGTTYGGGLYYGTIFKIDTGGVSFTILRSFVNSDGASPVGGLIQGTDGNLYGTASAGGSGGGGVIFKIGPCSLSQSPVITPGGPTTFCEGGSVTLDAGAGYSSYFWTPGGQTTQSIVVTASGSNTVTVTDATGCPGTSAPTVVTVIHPVPVITPSGPPTFCAGGSVTLDAGAGYSSYLWSPGGQTTRTIVVTTSGSYSVAVTDANGCQGSSAPTVVTVNPNPSPVITPGGPTTFCAGGSVTLDAGAGYASYLWSPGGQTTRTIVASTSGSYTVTVTAATGCVGTSTPTVVTVNPNPSPVITPGGPTTFCAGGSVTLDAGAGYSSYLWSPGGQTSETIIVSTSGRHTVTVTDANACMGTSAPIVVTVNPNPAPVITTRRCVAPNTAGLTASVPPHAGDTYNWTLTGGTIDSGQGTNAISFASDSPGTPMTLAVDETSAAGCVGTAANTLQADFSDVPYSDPFYGFVCVIARDGITAGCGAGNYCPDTPVTRAQMAVFLLKAEHGSSYTPPTCKGIFADVPCPGGFAVNWIEQLSTEGITAGCGGGNYCPDTPVTRAQMAVFLLKAEHGPAYTPPACTAPGVFGDVPCPGGFAVDWIEQLYAEGVTAGCGGGNYCPNNPNTRGQMAVFLVKTFGL